MSAFDAARAGELARLIARTGGPVLLVGAVPDVAGGRPHDRVDGPSFARTQLDKRYELILLGADALGPSEEWAHLALHTSSAHLLPGGVLATPADEPWLAAHARTSGFEQLGTSGAHWRRTQRRTIHDLLAETRAGIDRFRPEELQLELTRGRATVLDVRTPGDRDRDGVIEGSIHLPRTVLEWRCDPASGYSHPAVSSLDQLLVVVCTDGYSSSLAASSLRNIGFSRACDLIGGMWAWTSAGHPVVAPPADSTTSDQPVTGGAVKMAALSGEGNHRSGSI